MAAAVLQSKCRSLKCTGDGDYLEEDALNLLRGETVVDVGTDMRRP